MKSYNKSSIAEVRTPRYTPIMQKTQDEFTTFPKSLRQFLLFPFIQRRLSFMIDELLFVDHVRIVQIFRVALAMASFCIRLSFGSGGFICLSADSNGIAPWDGGSGFGRGAALFGRSVAFGFAARFSRWAGLLLAFARWLRCWRSR